MNELTFSSLNDKCKEIILDENKKVFLLEECANKRLYLPFKMSYKCPKCGNIINFNNDKNEFLLVDFMDELEDTMMVYCDECNYEYELNINIKPSIIIDIKNPLLLDTRFVGVE